MSRVISVLPAGETFDGTVEEFLLRTNKYFDEFFLFVQKWKSVLDTLNQKISIEEESQYPDGWKDDISNIMNNKEIHDKVTLEHDFSDLTSSLREFIEEALHLTLKRRSQRPDLSKRNFTSLVAETSHDKAQEVLNLTSAVSILFDKMYQLDEPILTDSVHAEASEIAEKIQNERRPMLRKNLHFVDIGAGKGFLSVFLAKELKIRSLANEASLSHSHQLVERIALLARKNRVDVNILNDLMRLCVGYVTDNTNIEAIVASSITYKQWTTTMLAKEDDPLVKMREFLLPKSLEDQEDTPAINVEDIRGVQTTKPRVIQGVLAQEIMSAPSEKVNLSPSETFCISIHACGNLSVVSHEIALRSKQCMGAISVPCCFQHLTDDKCPLMDVNRRTFDLLFAGDEEKRKDFLNYALLTYFVPYDKRQSTLQGFLQREIISAYIPSRVSVKKMKRGKDEDEISYYQRIVNSFENNNISKEVLIKRKEDVKNDIWKLFAQCILREYFGHAFESFILLDRLSKYAKMCEEVEGHDYTIGMFDDMSPFSPRCFCQFTLRNK